MTGSGPAPVTTPPPARPGAARPRRQAGTPATLRLLLLGLVSASVLWGALAAWTVHQHAAAATQVVNASEPLSLAAQRMYQSLSDADVTATSAFLAGPAMPLTVRQRYESDIAGAAADLAALQDAGQNAGTAQVAAGLSAISAGLPVYAGYVQQAQTYSALGHPLTGGSFMQVASEEMHLILLPAAKAAYARESSVLTATSARATGLPWTVATAAFACAVGFALLRAQRWLRRRTHRTVNYGMAAASLAVLVAFAWLTIASVSARADFQRGLGHGSTPAELLAKAGIAAQQARADEVLNLISRSGSTSFLNDFTAMLAAIGPGTGTLLTSAATASAGPGIVAAQDAARHARTWSATARQVFRLDVAASYAAETQLVIGTGPASSAASFALLEADLRHGIAADQLVFASSAAAGSAAYGGLEAGVILAALVLAAGSTWGLSRRLAEYR